jgi:hypothetical protein
MDFVQQTEVGKYYQATKHRGASCIVYVKAKNIYDGINTTEKILYRDHGTLVTEGYRFTEATPEQIKHLMSCLSAGKFVRRSTKQGIINDFLIY